MNIVRKRQQVVEKVTVCPTGFVHHPAHLKKVHSPMDLRLQLALSSERRWR